MRDPCAMSDERDLGRRGSHDAGCRRCEIYLLFCGGGGGGSRLRIIPDLTKILQKLSTTTTHYFAYTKVALLQDP